MKNTEKIYELIINNKEIDIATVMEENQQVLSIEMIKRISYAVDKNLPKIGIIRLISPEYVITISSERNYYKHTLTSCIEKLIKFEEYEMCSIAKKYIEILEKENVRV